MKPIRSLVGLLCSLVVLVGAASTAFAVDAYGPKGKRFGAGIYLGEPTGITLKGYLTSRMALDGIFAWSFIDDAFTMIGDVTYDFFDIPVSSGALSIPFYVGAGGKIGIDRRGKNSGRTLVGVRVPVGVALQWANHPIEVSFEVAPGIELAPATEFDLSGGLGIRFYF